MPVLTQPVKILLIIGVGIVGTVLVLTTHATTPTASLEAENGTLTTATIVNDTSASHGEAVRFGSGHLTCTVSATLVNSCRPWLGAAVNDYPGATTFAQRIANHESRIGRQLDVVHDYLTPGQVLSSDDITLAKRANTFLMANWKPTLTWADASGSDATVNTQIDDMAASIKSIAPKKIFLTIFHEPENDVSSGGSPSCGSSVTYKGSAGTTADYVAMWHNVRARFNADGVTNVVWVMNYMGYVGWDCMVNDLWPGNSYVDWIVWDQYLGTGSKFDTVMSRFYNKLTSLSDSTHDYLSKTWGINEWGDNSTSQSDVYQAYADAKTAIDTNLFPKIKLWDVFDNYPQTQTGGNGDYRIDYDYNHNIDPTEQADYNKFANDPNISGPFTGP